MTGPRIRDFGRIGDGMGVWAEAGEPSAQQGLGRELTRTVIVVIAGAVMTVLDATAVNVALQRLVGDLHSTVTTGQWVLTGYLVMLAVVVPVSGWATGRFGAKRLWMASLVTFVAGSALSGFAWSIGSLIAFRLLQGLGAGMISPLAQTILSRSAGPSRLARVMSVFGVIAVLGPVLGPVLGGVLVQYVGWRWIFFINLPIGILALAGAARVLPAQLGRASERLDVIGLLLASAGLAAVTFGLSQAGTRQVSAPLVCISVAAGVVLLGLFVAHARRRGPRALLDVGLLTERGFAAASAAMLLVGMVMLGAMLLVPLYYQSVRGQTALRAGLLLVPQGVGVAVVLALAGRLTDRWGARMVVVPGVVLILAGTLIFAQASPHTSYVWLMAALLVRGAGLGLVMTAVTAAAFVGLPNAAATAHASALITVMRQGGGSIGTALLTMILTSTAAVSTDPATGFRTAFWVASAVTALTLIPAILLPGPHPQSMQPSPTVQPATTAH